MRLQRDSNPWHPLYRLSYEASMKAGINWTRTWPDLIFPSAFRTFPKIVFVIFTHFCAIFILFFSLNEFDIRFSPVFFHHMTKSTSGRWSSPLNFKNYSLQWRIIEAGTHLICCYEQQKKIACEMLTRRRWTQYNKITTT